MDAFRSSSFVGEDSMELRFLEAGLLTIQGEISCLGNIVIRVGKTLAILDDGEPDPPVQTILYAYNASVRGRNSFLRHDNAHAYPGHFDEHHRHDFDWKTGENLPGSPSWVGADGWPTMSEFIEEVRDWYWKHKDELPSPHAYGKLGTRD